MTFAGTTANDGYSNGPPSPSPLSPRNFYKCLREKYNYMILMAIPELPEVLPGFAPFSYPRGVPRRVDVCRVSGSGVPVSDPAWQWRRCDVNDKINISLALSTSKNSLLKLAEQQARQAAEAARVAMAEVDASKDDPARHRQAQERARQAVGEVRMAMERVRRAKEEARKELERKARELKERQRRKGIEEPTILPNRRRLSQGLTVPDREPSTDPRALAPFLLMCDTAAEEALLRSLIKEGDLAVQGSQLVSQSNGLLVDVKVRVQDQLIDFRLGQRILVLVDCDEASATRHRRLEETLGAEGFVVLRLDAEALERDPRSAAERVLDVARHRES